MVRNQMAGPGNRCRREDDWLFLRQELLNCRNDAFDYPADYDPAEALGSAFGISAGQAPQRIRLLFAPELAPYVTSRQWHSTMRTKTRRDGQLEVTMEVTIGEELVHWLTGYGGKVKVQSPKGLREEVMSRHHEALQRS